MADEKQLTVAELLARSKKERASQGEESSEGEGSRRRHRRSIEEGGISVAELTGNLEKVTATPTQSKHSSVPIDNTAPVIPAPDEEEKADSVDQSEKADKQPGKEKSAEAVPEKAKSTETESEESAEKPTSEPRKSQPSTDDTTVIKRVSQTPTPIPEPEPTPAPKAAAATEVTPAPAPAKDTEADAAEEKPESLESTVAETDAYAGTDAEVTDTDATESEADEAEEGNEKLNAFSVILLAVIGIVIGAVVFKGFEILWDRFDRIVVATLAIMVTAASVGIVHALRTVRDGFSMGLAAFVGLVLTFGPLLIVM